MSLKHSLSGLLLTAVVGGLGLTACSGSGSSAVPTASAAPAETSAVVESAAVGSDGPIKVATTGSHAFFSQTNDKGELEGFEIDVWTEIGKRLDREIDWVEADFPGMMGLLESGKVDTAADQIGINAEREKVYNFSDVYFYVPYRLIVAEDDDTIHSVEDLYGKKIGLTAGEIANDYIAEMDPEGKIEVVDYEDSSVVPGDVVSGRVDASVMSALHIDTVKKESGLAIKAVGEPIYTEEEGYPFHKTPEGEALRDDVNEVLSQLREEGFLHETAVKWFGFDPMEVD